MSIYKKRAEEDRKRNASRAEQRDKLKGGGQARNRVARQKKNKNRRLGDY